MSDERDGAQWSPSPEALAEWGADCKDFSTWCERFGPLFLQVEHENPQRLTQPEGET